MNIYLASGNVWIYYSVTIKYFNLLNWSNFMYCNNHAGDLIPIHKTHLKETGGKTVNRGVRLKYLVDISLNRRLLM